MNSAVSVKGRDVFFNGVRVARILGSRTFVGGAVTPDSGYDVWINGHPNPYPTGAKRGLPYPYLADVIRDIKGGVYDTALAAAVGA